MNNRSSTKVRSKGTPIEQAPQRTNAEAWLTAAYQLLIEGGIESVRIAPLAERLGTSRTSFYWLFGNRDALLAALLELWRAKNTGNLVRQCELYAENISEASLHVCDCWLDGRLFDSQLELAIRSWAQQSERVAEEMRTADEARLAALRSMFVRFGITPLEADVRARTIYLVQIGYISMRTREDLATRMARIPAYMKVFTGVTPSQRELRRFCARHGFEPAPATEPIRRGGRGNARGTR